jgi:hypothetical protein
MSSRRYKCWRSNADKALHVICLEGEFERLPVAIRHLGPWTGGKEGEVERLKAHYRLLLAEQEFMLAHQHPFVPEAG